MIKKLPPLQGQNDYYPTPTGGDWYGCDPGVIFVAGTNLRGRHGAGAAVALSLHYGFPEGKSEGLHGRGYGIPTRDRRIHTLPLETIKASVDRFVQFTHDHPDKSWLVSAVGTGHAGYTHAQMGPLFRGVINCWLPVAWKQYLHHY